MDLFLIRIAALVLQMTGSTALQFCFNENVLFLLFAGTSTQPGSAGGAGGPDIQPGSTGGRSKGTKGGMANDGLPSVTIDPHPLNLPRYILCSNFKVLII